MPEDQGPVEQSVADVARQLNAVQIGMSSWAEGGSLLPLLRGFVATLNDAVDAMAAERSRAHEEGRREAAQEIARTIRAELVCCDVFDRHNGTSNAGNEHPICFWGEASARLADEVAVRGES